jgi:hypothetical protein
MRNPDRLSRDVSRGILVGPDLGRLPSKPPQFHVEPSRQHDVAAAAVKPLRSRFTWNPTSFHVDPAAAWRHIALE